MFVLPRFLPTKTENQFNLNNKNLTAGVIFNSEFNVNHLKTPKPLKAVYMTSWVAGTPSLRNKILKMIDRTEINAVIIDVKDYSGRISFVVSDSKVSKFGASQERIKDIRKLLNNLHQRGIYTIARISVFQDSYLVKIKPEWAVKKNSNKEIIWRDHKGIAWLDVGNRGVWRYVADIGHYAYSVGFDELNFDYIRFPSDGNMKDIYYPASNGKEKREVLRRFFGFLYKEFRDSGAILSADLFGMTTINTDDLNIGQYLEYALPYFDYVSPMVYPSHYPSGFIGILNPASEPYKVIRYSLDEAVKRASTTPDKIRPWLQDFNLGADYNADMIRAQIQAVYDSGLDSFMLWSPSNRYTEKALLKE